MLALVGVSPAFQLGELVSHLLLLTSHGLQYATTGEHLPVEHGDAHGPQETRHPDGPHDEGQ